MDINAAVSAAIAGATAECGERHAATSGHATAALEQDKAKLGGVIEPLKALIGQLEEEKAELEGENEVLQEEAAKLAELEEAVAQIMEAGDPTELKSQVESLQAEKYALTDTVERQQAMLDERDGADKAD